jgi:hypothetical protein
LSLDVPLVSSHAKPLNRLHCILPHAHAIPN